MLTNTAQNGRPKATTSTTLRTKTDKMSLWTPTVNGGRLRINCSQKQFFVNFLQVSVTKNNVSTIIIPRGCDPGLLYLFSKQLIFDLLHQLCVFDKLQYAAYGWLGPRYFNFVFPMTGHSLSRCCAFPSSGIFHNFSQLQKFFQYDSW